MIFIIYYLIEVCRYLFKKKITLRKSFRTSYTTILIFLLFVITNFQVWYIMWLIPLMMFQNKKAIKSTINLTISSEIACTVFFALSESYIYGHYFFGTMIILWVILNLIQKNLLLEIKDTKI